MNNQEAQFVRKRGQTLLIVEGNHEKNELFQTLFRCFPELSIDMEDVWIYGTNIYKLYDSLVKEYGELWYEDDIDLPLFVSKKMGIDKQYREDFVNIFLVFDYERHDPSFSEEKINRLQEYFTDAADMGMLYINYPMIESYQHINYVMDENYMNLCIPVSLQPGKEYKALVRNSFMDKAISHPPKLHNLLKERFEVKDENKLKEVVEDILNLDSSEELQSLIEEIVARIVSQENIKTAKFQIIDIVKKIGYAENNKNYWKYMRTLFQRIIIMNIKKANNIQGIPKSKHIEVRSLYDELSLSEVLSVQNEVSRDENTGFIWVLNTCIMLIAEYNTKLLEN